MTLDGRQKAVETSRERERASSDRERAPTVTVQAGDGGEQREHTDSVVCFLAAASRQRESVRL